MTAAQLKAVATGHAAEQTSNVLQELLQRPFDVDAWHAMQERDNALIRDEITHGAVSKAFVYEFEISGKKVRGVSVIGARELASQYKGIKSRIIATVEKRGALFIFRTFTPLSIDTRVLPELASDDDFYECVTEVSDIKSGNSIEVRKKETKFERRRDGTTFERPHYDVIAESKAYRNGVLSVLPQSVIEDFKLKCLAAGNKSNEQTIDQRRAAATAHAAKHGIPLNRQALSELSFAELDGLGAAAKEGVDAFKRSAIALGLVGGDPGNGAPASPPPPPPAPPAPAAKKAAGKGAAKADAPPPKRTYAQFVDQVQNAADAESAAVFLDEARGALEEQMQGELAQVYRAKWGQ